MHAHTKALLCLPQASWQSNWSALLCSCVNISWPTILQLLVIFGQQFISSVICRPVAGKLIKHKYNRLHTCSWRGDKPRRESTWHNDQRKAECCQNAGFIQAQGFSHSWNVIYTNTSTHRSVNYMYGERFSEEPSSVLFPKSVIEKRTVQWTLRFVVSVTLSCSSKNKHFRPASNALVFPDVVAHIHIYTNLASFPRNNLRPRLDLNWPQVLFPVTSLCWSGHPNRASHFGYHWVCFEIMREWIPLNRNGFHQLVFSCNKVWHFVVRTRVTAKAQKEQVQMNAFPQCNRFWQERRTNDRFWGQAMGSNSGFVCCFADNIGLRVQLEAVWITVVVLMRCGPQMLDDSNRAGLRVEKLHGT